MNRAQPMVKRLAALSLSNSTHSILAPPLISVPRLLSFSSDSPSPPDVTPPPSPDDDLPSDVSTPELKRRIERYLSGDGEALPSIFEAILVRKLSGKHGDTDDEILEEFQSKTPPNDEDEVSETDDDSSDSDDELSD